MSTAGAFWVLSDIDTGTWQGFSIRYEFGLYLTLAGGILACLAGATGLLGVDTSRGVAGSAFERRVTDVHCKKCGSGLIGSGGPCRKCDDVKTAPCASCERYILTSDKTCPYCGANLK